MALMPSNTADARLAESTLPLAQISLDSVHEKNVRHGHLSTLHIWPARRPLAASRAMILATLLPDSGDAESRRRLGTRMAGRLVPKRRNDGGEHPKLKETSGGILHWGARMGRSWNAFGMRSGPCSAAHRACWTPSRAAGRLRWRRCGWGARRSHRL